jgi:cytosine/uracil/thiamine/allantoin permease
MGKKERGSMVMKGKNQGERLVKRAKLGEEKGEDWWRCGRIWRYLVMLLCPVALILFLVLEDMNLPMTWMNELSGAMLVILGMEVVFLVFYWWGKNQKICKRRLFNSPKFGEDEEDK